MDDERITRQANLRRSEISEILNSQHEVSVQELADRFGVSNMTIRRDLAFLEKQGLAIRTHGGAVLTGKLRFLQDSYPEHESPVKRAIGKLGTTLVREGETVMVDSGSTSLEVAQHLPRNMGLTLATTSLRVAQALYGSGIKVLVLGGFLREDSPSLFGPLAEQALHGLTVDTLFMDCDGADSRDGFYVADLLVASLAQAMVASARRVIVVTESAKFERRSFARSMVPQQVQYVVTDPALSDRDRSNLEDRGVKVLIAEPTAD